MFLSWFFLNLGFIHLVLFCPDGAKTKSEEFLLYKAARFASVEERPLGGAPIIASINSFQGSVRFLW